MSEKRRDEYPGRHGPFWASLCVRCVSVCERAGSRALALGICASLRCRFCQDRDRRVSLRVCSGCAAARYCFRECQEVDLSEHCEVCRPFPRDLSSAARSLKE